MPSQKTLLDRWKEHPTRRQEFLAILREPVMQDALAIVREQIFAPKPLQVGTPDLLAWAALLAQKREGYLEMFANFVSLADLSPFKHTERKPWETVDRAAAERKIREDFGLDNPPPPQNGPAPVQPSTTAGEEPPVK